MMKRIIIALILAMTMVISSVAVYAEDTVADAIYENASNTYVVPVLKAGTQPIELLASAGGSSPSAGSTPSTGGTHSGAVTEKADEIIVISANTNDMYLSEDSFTVYVSFLDKQYISDARENLKVSLVDSKYNLVAESVDAKYDDNFNYCIAYTLNIVNKSLFTEGGEYQLEFEYTGDSIVTYQLPAMYIYPKTNEMVKSYEITDQTTATVNVTIANAVEDGEYYIYLNDFEQNFYPVAQSGNVYTFCFNDVYTDIVEWSSFKINGALYRIYDADGTTSSTALHISDIYISGRLSSQTYFDDEWNGIYVIGTIASTDKEIYLTLEPYNENSATGKDDMGSYIEDDANYISISLYDSTTYSTIPVTYSLEYFEDANGRGNYETYSCFDAEISLSKTLTCDRKYYIAVTDRYSTRLEELIIEDGISCDTACINDGNYYNEYSFYFNDTYDCVVYSAKGMTDITKFDAKILNYMGEPLAVLDRETLNAETVYNTKDIYFNLKSTGTGQTSNLSDYNFNIYYDGKVILSQKMNGYYGGGYSDSYYYNFYVFNSYSVKGEKLVALANFYTDDPDYDMDDFSLKLYDENNNEIAFEKKTEVVNAYNNKYFVFEHDIKNLTNYQFIYRYSFDGVNEHTDYLYPMYTDSDSFIFENLTHSDEENYTVFGYNLTPGNYTVCMIGEETDTQYSVPATASSLNTYTFNIKLSDVPDVIMKKYGFIEFNGKFIDKLPLDDFTYTNGGTNSAFYSEYLNQNSKLAIVNLPSKLYSSYRISTNEKELATIGYSAIKDQIIYKMPDADGDYMLYAQFKDANGRESGILKTRVIVVSKTPDFKVTNDLSKTYTAVYDNYMYNFDCEYTSSVDGKLYIQLYTDNGSAFYSKGGYKIADIDNDYNVVPLTISQNFEYMRFVNKMELWFEDDYGNKTAPVFYDVKFTGRYINYEIGDGYIYFDTQDGRVISLNNLSGHVTIPSYIEGFKVRELDSYILTNSPDITSISLPSTIESMYMYSLDYNYYITIYVNEGSYAHSVLSGTGYRVVLKGNCGDINGDGQINGADLLRLAKYFAGWDVAIDEETSDTNADGEINAADVLRLAKYLAGHNVTLGE